MTIKRLLAIICILLASGFGWMILGASLQFRTAASTQTLGRAVSAIWGPPMTQEHPSLYYLSPNKPNGRYIFQPSSSNVNVKLSYEPKKKGLLWNRTYLVNFMGNYTFENPAPIPQTIYIQFKLPSKDATYNHFSFLVNGKPTVADDNRLHCSAAPPSVTKTIRRPRRPSGAISSNRPITEIAKLAPILWEVTRTSSAGCLNAAST